MKWYEWTGRIQVGSSEQKNILVKTYTKVRTHYIKLVCFGTKSNKNQIVEKGGGGGGERETERER